MTQTMSRLSVRQEAYDEFSVYYLGKTIIATATHAIAEGWWEVVLINERNEQDTVWFCTPECPTPNDVTISHNTHFNKREVRTNGKDED